MPGGPCQRVRVWVRAALIAAAWLELTPPDEQIYCAQSFPSLAHVTCECVHPAITVLVVRLDVNAPTVSRGRGATTLSDFRTGNLSYIVKACYIVSTLSAACDLLLLCISVVPYYDCLFAMMNR